MALSITSLFPAVPIAAGLIEQYSPGIRRRVLDRLASTFFGGIGVPENHVVTRTVRMAWIEAAREILKEARKISDVIDGGEFTQGFEGFAECFEGELQKEADRALDLRTTRDLAQSPIDAYMMSFVAALGAHLANRLEDTARTELNKSFASVVAQMTFRDEERIPPIVTRLADNGFRVGDGARRNFAERVLDMLAFYMQHPEKFPKVQMSLHAALLEHHMGELKDLLASRGSSLDELTGGPELTDCMRRDLEGMEARLHTAILGAGAKVDVVSSKVDELKEDFREFTNRLVNDFGRTADVLVSDTFAFQNESTVIFAWTQDGADWWEKCANQLRSALDRLGPDYELAPQAWDLGKVDLRSPQGLEHARNELWNEFGGANGHNHAASVIKLGRELSKTIPCDRVFEDKLFAQGLLVGSSETGKFFLADGLDHQKVTSEIQTGHIPITLETRIMLETWMAGRTLLVVDATDEDNCAVEVKSLLRWATAAKVSIGRADDMLQNDRWAIRFAHMVFEITAAATPNPYRRLDHYLPENAAQFFGRDRQTEQVRRWMDDRNGLLSITGPSGVGKSSFLNARVAWLMAGSGYEYVGFRPTDLHIGPNYQTAVSSFCEMVSERLDLGQVDPLVVLPDTNLAAKAAMNWLDRTIPSRRKLFFAIDQFEEIVDYIANGNDADGWRAVLQIVSTFSAKRNDPLAFTLEDSRRKVYNQVLAGTAYHSPTEIALSDDDTDFVRAVIAAPFADAGFVLDEKVIEELIKEYVDHSSTGPGDYNSSALPLLALKLYSLFNFVTRSPRLAAKSSKLIFGDGGDPVTRKDIESFPLSITEEIKNLASQAWEDSDGGSEADLGAFLRPFISVVPTSDDDDPGQGRLVLNAVPERSFYSTANRQNAFLKRRLLVPTPGGYRLTHQAVIHRWPLAAAWFRKESESILKQGLFLRHAVEWEKAGRPPIQEASASDIAIAARYLSIRSIDWAIQDRRALPPEERRDCEYSIAIFETSDDGEELIEGTSKGNRIIHTAAAYGLNDMLGRILNKTPEAIHLLRTDNSGVLSCAAWGNCDTVALLLEHSADPHQMDENGFYPLHSPIWGGNNAIFDLLLSKTDARVGPEQRQDPLYSAARCGRLDYVVKLEQRGYQHDAPSLHGLNSLMGAALNDDQQVFDHCLARCDLAKRSAQGLTAFDLLALTGRTGLMLAALRHPQGAACLLPGPDGTTPLMHAAHGLQLDAVQFLLMAGCDPNAQTKMEGKAGRTALHFALDYLSRHKGPAPRFVAERTRNTVGALLEHENLNVSIADEKNTTAYDMAEHHSGLRAMIAAHSSFSPAAIPNGSDTPLHIAIRQLQKTRDPVAKEGVVAQIREFLADERYGTVATRAGTQGKIPTLELVALGLGDDVIELIENKLVDPWSPELGGGVLATAWRANHRALIELAAGQIPQSTTVKQVVGLAGALCDVRDPDQMNMQDASFDVLETCIERCQDAAMARDSTVALAARLGNMPLFDKLCEIGADIARKDDWGRDVLDRASNFVREQRQKNVSAPAIKPEKPLPDLVYRSDFASGDMTKIRKLISTLPANALPDDWGRMPADLVPDRLFDEVKKLTDGKNKRRLFWRRLRK